MLYSKKFQRLSAGKIHTLGALSPHALPRQRALWRRVLKVLDRLLAVVIVFIAIVCLFLQTNWFRDVLISEIERIVEKETGGQITIESIGGNFLSGFTLNDVHLKLRNSSDTSDILSVNQVYVRYNVVELLAGKGIAIKELKLRSPIFCLTKEQGDTIWNLDKLLPPKSSASTDNSSFTTVIDLRTVRIEDGTISIHDKNDTSQPEKEISSGKRKVRWSDVFLQGVNLDLSALIHGEDSQTVHINHFNLRDDRSGFTIHRLGLKASRVKDNVALDSMILVTDESTLSLAAAINPLTILSGAEYESIGKSITSLQLHSQRISTAELRQFIPSVDFLGDSPGIDLTAKGEYGKLSIQSGKLNFYSTGAISFKGSVLNLHKPEDIYFDLSLVGRNLSAATLKTYVPGIETGDLSRYGNINLKNITFKGRPDNFSSEIDIETYAGLLQGNVTLDLRSKDPIFDLDLAANKINLGVILADNSLISDLNVDLKVKGRHFDPKYMEGEFIINTSSPTSFGKYGVTDLSTTGSLSRGILTVRNTDAVLAGGGTLTSDFAIVDFNHSQPSYEVDLVLSNIPIEQYIDSMPKNMRVSLSANVMGEGMSLDALEGSIRSKIQGLQYRGERLNEVSLDGFFQRNGDGTRSDNIVSDVADISLEGRYTIERAARTIVDHVNATTRALSLGYEDSLNVSKKSSPHADEFDVTYSIALKDLRALSSFIPQNVLLGEGRISGVLKEQKEGMLDITAEGEIYKLLVKNRITPQNPEADKSGVNVRVFDTTRFSVKLRNLSEDDKSLLDDLQASVNIQSNSPIRTNGIFLSSPEVSLSLDQRSVQYVAQSGINDILRVYLKGTGTYHKDKAIFPIDTVVLDFGNNFIWQTENTPTVTLDHGGRMILDTLAFYRPELGYDPENLLAQRIKFGFDISNDSILHAFVDAPQLKLKDLPMFATQGIRKDEFASLTGRITRLHGEVSGPFSNLHAKVDMLVRNFMFNDITFDSSMIFAELRDHTLRGTSIFRVDTGKFIIDSRRAGKSVLELPLNNKFSVVLDSFPVMFSLSDDDTSKVSAYLRSRREFSLRASADGYPLDFFGPFLPLVTNVHGLITADVRAFGTIDSIQLAGTAIIDSSTMTILSTNVPYHINGKLSLDENEIRFDSIDVKNLAEDDPDGVGFLVGKLEMNGLTPGGFDFTLSTDRLTVMTDATKSVLPTMYGPLAIRTGTRPLHFFGNLEEPRLSGDVTIVQGFLTLPQNTNATTSNAGDIVYRTISTDFSTTDSLVDSIVTLDVDTTELSLYDIEDMIIAPTKPKESPEKEKQKRTKLEGGTLAFSDKMLYDLDIAIPGDFWINIFFTRGMGLIGEQLSAELQTPRNLLLERDRAGAPLRFTGNLQLTERSSYKFIRNFTPVTGTISFINDITNPFLNITAEYGAYNSIRTSDFYKILLKITGTADQPNLSMEIYKRNESTRQFTLDGQHNGDQAAADGLYFLTSNAFQSDLSQTESASVASQLATTIPSGLANSVINGLVGSSFLKDYLRNVSLDYSGSLATTKLKLTAGYKDFTFQYGAQSLADPSAADYSVEVPLAQFVKFKKAKNIVFGFTAHTYSLTSVKTSVLTQPNYEASVMYHFQIP